ncbi:MAG: hypothetical protein WCS90_01675 [Bacilli bacterium]
MKTRIEKYKRYRERIERTPENKFPVHRNAVRTQTHADKEVIAQSARPASAVAYKSVPLKRKRITPYSEYSKKQRLWLMIKGVSLLMTIAAFACLYFFWVIKG